MKETIPAPDCFYRYVQKYGLPVIYIDEHTTYRSTDKPSIEEELNGKGFAVTVSKGTGPVRSKNNIC